MKTDILCKNNFYLISLMATDVNQQFLEAICKKQFVTLYVHIYINIVISKTENINE